MFYEDLTDERAEALKNDGVFGFEYAIIFFLIPFPIPFFIPCSFFISCSLG